MQPVLSIIIPIYNVENYLAECLDSVFAQKIKNMEVVCINDGSTDNSLQIAENYAQRYSNIHVISQNNQGLSAARNTGIRHATGDYVFFLDSDDTLNDASVLNEMYILAQKQEADIVVFNALVNGESPYLSPFPTQTEAINGTKLMQLFYNCNQTLMIPIWGHLYRKQFLLDNNLWFKEGIYHEDIQFTPIAQYLASRAVCHDTCVVNYRWQRPGAITSKGSSKHYIDKRNTGRELFQWFNSNNTLEDEPYRFTFSVYDELICTMVEKGDKPNTILKPIDYEIMKQCYRTKHERKQYRLACISSSLLYHYQNNTLPPLFRKIINHLL